MLQITENPRTLLLAAAGLLCLAGGFCAWIASLSRLDLSYAYTLTCASALIVAALSVVVLGKSVSPRMWLGTILVTAGVGLLVYR